MRTDALVRKIFICVFAVSHINDSDCLLVVVNLVDYPIITDSNAIAGLAPHQFAIPGRKRIFCQHLYSLDNAKEMLPVDFS